MANTLFHGHGEYILQCRCDCCEAGLACPYEVKGALQAVLHGTLNPLTLSTHLTRHNIAEQQEGTFSCWASLA